jgi:transcriptional regulator with XRE-family HTH domain
MYQEFAMDLKVARRKSGLTQVDCAHLVGIHETLLSQMENGRRMPTVKEICSLSMIYGRSFESLFSGVFQDVRSDLKERLITIPKAPKAWIGSLNRQNSIDRLAQDLVNNGGNQYGL